MHYTHRKYIGWNSFRDYINNSYLSGILIINIKLYLAVISSFILCLERSFLSQDIYIIQFRYHDLKPIKYFI